MFLYDKYRQRAEAVQTNIESLDLFFSNIAAAERRRDGKPAKGRASDMEYDEVRLV